MIFDFLRDYGTYESRKVDRWDNEDGTKMVSTAACSDGRKPFETAVMHPAYNEGKMVIVECYDKKVEAQIGHDKWLNLMLTNKLPNTLVDCANAEIGQLCDDAGCSMAFERKAD